jgi:hypothetical protein
LRYFRATYLEDRYYNYYDMPVEYEID